MRSPVPALAVVLVILAVVAAVVGPATASGGALRAAPAEPGPAASGATPRGDTDHRSAAGGSVESPPPNFTRPDPAVVVTIDLRENGNARWTVTSRFNLSNDTDVAVFREFADTVAEGGRNGDLGYSVATFEQFSDRVENATNRSEEMAIRNASWRHRVENGNGSLSLQFTWTNFARTDGQQVILNDVFTAENGTWFDELSEDQRLVINEPPGYSVESSPFPFTEGTIVLDGPRDVDTGGIPIVYTPTATSPPSSPTQTTQGPLSPLALGGGFVVLVLVVAAVLVLFSRRRRVGEEPAAGSGTGTTDGGEATGETAAESPSAAGPGGAAAEAEAETAAGDADAETEDAETEDAEAGDRTAAGEEEPEEEEIDEELLSDEERVERLLRQNGGRMKQANIVTETGWSNAKVSQLLSSMDEDDRIDKLRIGRENLITLPDEDVGELN